MKKQLEQKKSLFADVVVPEGLHNDASRALKCCALCGGIDVDRIYLQAHFPVVRCRKCSLIYADEHFRDEDLTRFYSGDYYQRAYVCHPPQIDAKIAGDYVREFRRVDDRVKGGSLLDFGSARGTFLAALMRTEMGARWRCEGVDINADEIAMGRAKGLPVRVADISGNDVPSSTYEAVTAFSVIEHMKDPRAILAAVRRVLKPDGHFLMIVPNGKCLIISLGRLAAALFGDRVRSFTDNVFHEEHLYYFSPLTARRMLNECGFDVVEIGFQPSYLETHAPGIALKLPAALLRFASWVFRRQTMLLVLARRRSE